MDPIFWSGFVSGVLVGMGLLSVAVIFVQWPERKKSRCASCGSSLKSKSAFGEDICAMCLRWWRNGPR